MGFGFRSERRAILTPCLAHRGNRAAGPAGAESGSDLEAPALVAGLDDLATVSEPVEQGCDRLGVALSTVARMLGHSDPKMTLRYAHVTDPEVEAAAERIGRADREGDPSRDGRPSDAGPRLNVVRPSTPAAAMSVPLA